MDINYVGLYAITASLFLVLDGLWLGVVAKKLYATELKGLLTTNVKWGAAVLFYALFVAGLIYFVIAPALIAGATGAVVPAAAFFGLVTYATYDLTNYSTLKGFPLKIVLIDLLWGTVISTVVATAAFAIYKNYVA